jgi:peptide deformylase
MAIREILKAGNHLLTKKCHQVTRFDQKLHALLDDMSDTLKEARGAGLAAPQVGIMRRVCIVDTGEGKILEIINPQIIDTQGSQTGAEGCLSVPGKYGIVTRPAQVTIRAQNRNGQFFEATGQDLVARAFCHETDHLDGKLFVEKVERYLDPEELEDDDE